MKYMDEIIVAYSSTKNITKCTPKYSIYIFSKNLWDDFGSEIFKKSKTILFFQFFKTQRRFCFFSSHTIYRYFFNKIINILYLYFIKTSGTILSLKFFKSQRRFCILNFSKITGTILYFQSYKKETCHI